MNSKSKTQKNVIKLVAFVLAALMIIGLLATFTQGSAPAPMFDYSKGLTEEGFFEGVNAQESVKLPDYEAYTMPKDKTIASEDELKTRFEVIKSDFTTEEKDVDTERAIKDGDRVNIDYVGKTDGKEFEGGSTNGKGTDVTLGVTQYIPGFLEQLVGHKPGETFDIDVKFPDDYHMEDLKGKDAVFTITVNHYYKPVVPEITDEFVEKNFNGQYKTVDELTKALAEQIVKTDTVNYMLDKLFEESEVLEYPEVMMTYETELAKLAVAQQAAQLGMTAEDFVKLVGVESLDAYVESVKPQIKEKVKMNLIIQAIAEKEGMSISEDDIMAHFEKLFADFKKEDYKAFKDIYGVPYIKLAVMHDKVIENIVAGMEVVDAPAETPAPEATPAPSATPAA